MAYTAAALSFMLAGFRKPIVLTGTPHNIMYGHYHNTLNLVHLGNTGSQLPLLNPRTDARTNLLDAITCATAYFTPPHVQLQEVCVCFGGLLLRGNRAQKVDSMMYRAFASPTMPPLATLGVEVQWNKNNLLQPEGSYRPRFKLCVWTVAMCSGTRTVQQGCQRHQNPHRPGLRPKAGLWGPGGARRQGCCSRVVWRGQHA